MNTGHIARAEVESRTLLRGNLVVPLALREKPVKELNFSKASWKSATAKVFQQVGVRVAFDGVPDTTITMTSPRPRPFVKVLESLARLGGVDCRIDSEGVFHMVPVTSGSGVPERPDLDKRPFWVVETGVPVRALLERVFREANLPVEIDPAVTGAVSMNFRGVIFRRVLAGILRATSGGPELTYRVEDGKFYVYPLEREYTARPATGK